MKFLLLITCLALCGCSSAIKILSEEQINREYAGVVKVGEPKKTEKGIEIPLLFSGGGWMHNSGICYKRNETEVNERIITLKIFTSVCTGDTITPQIILDQQSKGKYQIEFEDPDGQIHHLTEILIPEAEPVATGQRR